jgi:very-short-patch-repair endonuclease
MASETARRLRRTMTDSEWRLWLALRGRQLDGHRFRRQHPIGPFVVDFVCLAHRLVIEIDGGVHLEPEQQAQDRSRQRWLEGQGYRVLRFRGVEMADDIGGVLATIRAALG